MIAYMEAQTKAQSRQASYLGVLAFIAILGLVGGVLAGVLAVVAQ